MRVPIGGRLTVVEDERISSITTGDVLQVKVGDEGFVDSRGVVHYTSGEASGTVQKVYEQEQMVGYDHVSISEMVSDKLDEQFTLESILEDEGIEYDKVIIEIVKVLKEVL